MFTVEVRNDESVTSDEQKMSKLIKQLAVQ